MFFQLLRRRRRRFFIAYLKVKEKKSCENREDAGKKN